MKHHFPLYLIPLILLSTCTQPTEPKGFVMDDKPVNQIASDVVQAVIEPDGTIWTWGHNSLGTLGNGTTENSDVPGQVLNVENAVALDLFFGIALAADQSGNIWFWGNYSTASVNSPNIVSPIKLSYLPDVKSIHVFSYVAHLLRKDGTVWSIQLDSSSPSTFVEAIQVEGLDRITQLSEWAVLRDDGTIHYLKEIRLDDDESISDLTGVIEIANVQNHRTVILKNDGTVWSWGYNDVGQLGNGTLDDSLVPVKASGLTDIVSISANYRFNLALKADGTVWYWGLDHVVNGPGSTGISIPLKIENLDDVELIYAGISNIVRKNDGTYWIFDHEERIPEQVQLNRK